MHPINFPGAIEIGKPENTTDDQCFSMPAQPVDYIFTGADGKQYPARFWVEAWKPSKEDIEAINRGEPIWIHVHCGAQLVPISVFTLNENGESNDAG